jgi:hypothetical protein
LRSIKKSLLLLVADLVQNYPNHTRLHSTPNNLHKILQELLVEYLLT